MKASELLDLLREFYTDKLTLLKRHAAAARLVSDYDFNNTYQYVIAREEMHVSWLADAVFDVASDMGHAEPAGMLPEVQDVTLSGSGKSTAAQQSVIQQDCEDARQFVDRWRPRVEAIRHARHRTMLNVILGETLEHKRFFEQALAGRTDLLGRRADGAGTGGGVLPTRWVER